jgi:hypothetical protein
MTELNDALFDIINNPARFKKQFIALLKEFASEENLNIPEKAFPDLCNSVYQELCQVAQLVKGKKFNQKELLNLALAIVVSHPFLTYLPERTASLRNLAAKSYNEIVPDPKNKRNSASSKKR